MPMIFTIAGRRVNLTKESVTSAVRDITPQPIKKYRVSVGEKDFPIKQVVSAASGVPIAAFISTDAYRILTRLGFEVKAD